MVERHLAGRGGLTDQKVLAAFREVPREKFVLPQYRDAAYADQALPIGGGQTISQPYVIALIFQALGLRGDERVLEIGTGSGYSAAILARLAREVYTVDRDANLVAGASRVLAELGVDNVTALARDGNHGLPEHAPFGAIAVHALADELPGALVEQTANGGRIVAPVKGRFGDRLMVYTRTEDGVRSTMLDAVKFVPLVPGTTGSD